MTGDDLKALTTADLGSGDLKVILGHLGAIERRIEQFTNRVLEALAEINKREDGQDNRLSLLEQHAVVLERRVTELERPLRKAKK